MYFNDNQMAVIVVECGIEPGHILPKNWDLNCILTFIIRKKLVEIALPFVSDQGGPVEEKKPIKVQFYAEGSKVENFEATFSETENKVTHNTGLTLDEILDPANCWIDEHTNCMNIEIDLIEI